MGQAQRSKAKLLQAVVKLFRKHEQKHIRRNLQQPILVSTPVTATSSVPKETSRMQELGADSAVRQVCRGCSSSSQEPIQLGAQLQKEKMRKRK